MICEECAEKGDSSVKHTKHNSFDKTLCDIHLGNLYLEDTTPLDGMWFYRDGPIEEVDFLGWDKDWGHFLWHEYGTSHADQSSHRN